MDEKSSFRLWLVAAGLCVLLCAFTAFGLAILLPEASGTETLEKGGAVVDVSHSDQGYIMVSRASGKAQKLRLSVGKASLNYDLSGTGEYEVFPLQLGNGKYKVEIFEQVSGKKYSPVASVSFSAKLEEPWMPFLYPNQYISYNADTKAVAKSMEICANATTDAEKVEAVYEYMINNMQYNYAFAAEVGRGMHKGYIPTVDATLEEDMGVCFDFSALIACMLRAQGIPTQLTIGYADKTYHAWNTVLVDGEWKLYDATMVICQGQVKNYTAERNY